MTRASPWPAVAAYGIALIASLELTPAALAALGGGHRPRFALSLPGLACGAAVEGLVLIVVALVTARLAQPGAALAPMLGLGRGEASIAGSLAAISATTGASLALGSLVGLAGVDAGPVSRAVESAVASASWGGVALALVGLAAVPAVCEEIFFRGLLQGRLRKAWGARTAVVGAAAAFGVFHVDLVQGAEATVVGIVLGAVVERLGSVRISIAAHGINNVLFVLLMATGPRHAVPGGPICSLVAGGVLAAASGLLLRAPCALRASTRAS